MMSILTEDGTDEKITKEKFRIFATKKNNELFESTFEYSVKVLNLNSSSQLSAEEFNSLVDALQAGFSSEGFDFEVLKKESLSKVEDVKNSFFKLLPAFVDYQVNQLFFYYDLDKDGQIDLIGITFLS